MLSALKDEKRNVHILYTDSSLLEILVYDSLKEVCEANLESIITVESSSGFNEMMDLVNINPFLAKRWLFIITYKKVKKLLTKAKGIFSYDSSCFLIKVENYKEFKEAKELFPAGSNELYLAYMGYKDVMWLLDGSGLSQSLMDYVARSYSRDPDKIMQLVSEIKNGLKVEDRKGIVSISGTSTGSVATFALSLLGINVNTERGAKMSLRKKLNEAISLSRLYGPSSLRNFLLASLKDMMYIKEMYLNGDLYDSIRDLPECFDEKRMLRYRMYLKSILALKLEDITRLYVRIAKSGSWQKEVDVVGFIYDMYESEVRAI